MSVIYDLSCADCNTSLEFKVSMDNDGDITVLAETCKECMEKEFIKGRQEAEDERN